MEHAQKYFSSNWKKGKSYVIGTFYNITICNLIECDGILVGSKGLCDYHKTTYINGQNYMLLIYYMTQAVCTVK